jgi:hypothetical protein
MTMATEQSIPLTREEVLQAQPNQWVFQFEVNAGRVYPVHYFCDNTKGVRNHNAYAVCTYQSLVLSQARSSHRRTSAQRSGTRDTCI